mmetsp:Transcript_58966/g.129449  ORF Transcript_58966/g.129449 Transcript_58966/m.129449 type:complete len:159 (+) Transcript_58966:635-1111(+)
MLYSNTAAWAVNGGEPDVHARPEKGHQLPGNLFQLRVSIYSTRERIQIGQQWPHEVKCDGVGHRSIGCVIEGSAYIAGADAVSERADDLHSLQRGRLHVGDPVYQTGRCCFVDGHHCDGNMTRASADPSCVSHTKSAEKARRRLQAERQYQENMQRED